jgi:hypothetical protein
MKKNWVVLAAALSLFGFLPAFAEVADSGAGGFTIKESFNIHSTPEEVYRRMVRNVGDWWSSQHTFSGDSGNLSIDDKPLGCFCEKLSHGGGVRHMEVIYAAPGERLRMSGALGPLQPTAATGTMDIHLSSGADGGTTVDVTYTVSGYLPKGLDSWARPVDGVLHEQFSRLKGYVEHGLSGLPSPAPR